MTIPENSAARLTRLEENAVFQERGLEELNSALIAQQSRIDELERRLERAETLVRLLREQLPADGTAIEVPPHYQFLK